ncbi:hypothetical protein BC477_19585 [Clavibacter michiganensis subsp. michiganensis]|uniref:Uncharacterized protein n=1 Tax=Clavibacter michiganensis subsp. michiganensis TaxID=33013 RepID=A0A251XEY4_CLAMM|nr:hypothetical protein BC477_19585 [Clavibacter michiganensis subsp. michiganensis]OUE00554.1 hypothetical protein CMMCAS07_17455 [Clavibacter michiganensis subsp. michiganensis]
MSRVSPGVSPTMMIVIAAVRSGRPWIMFRWRRGKSVPTEAAPAASEPRQGGQASVTAPPAPVVSTATGELAAIAARLHGGPVRPTHVPAHKALPEEPSATAATSDADDAPPSTASRTSARSPSSCRPRSRTTSGPTAHGRSCAARPTRRPASSTSS